MQRKPTVDSSDGGLHNAEHYAACVTNDLLAGDHYWLARVFGVPDVVGAASGDTKALESDS